MNYKVLYRKYRPDNFDSLIGQDHIKNILKNSIINDKIAHAYIFTGPRGTGKTSTAKIFAKTLNCLDIKDGISCGKCENCLNFNTTPDIIEMDAASNNGVENIRDIIQNIEIAPTSGKYKIYIIDEVHMLSTSAWNAFLKTLEEPPVNVIFILATTDIQKVPITVLSRCQRFDFTRIDKDLIKENLKNICDKENISYEEEALMEISYLSDGCMRDALSILDQLSKISSNITYEDLKNNYGTVSNEEIDQIYLSILHNDVDELVSKVRNIKESGIDIKILINKMLDNFIDKAISMKKKGLSNNSFNQIKNIINSLNELLVKINSSTNGFLLLELEFISFINDDNNQLTKREINQIISREIISSDVKIDVKALIKDNNDKQIYKICDDFINIRINNAFVNASKDYKAKFSSNLDNLKKIIEEKELNEYKVLIKNIKPQVVGDTNVLLITNSESSKIIGNSKLYNFESLYNSEFKSNYKMIFITLKEWNKYMESYDKNKKYSYIYDNEYMINEDSVVSMAEELFGNDTINIE